MGEREDVEELEGSIEYGASIENCGRMESDENGVGGWQADISKVRSE